ncbi:MAG TPA: hypothetical protein VLX92_08240 [Kofleriaceae bacterium]|nr:hypothetical protein [Kofleriaceae bacterium]
MIEVPAFAAGVWLLARLGVGDRLVPFMRLVRFTAVFAGIAAVLTAAGVGRIAAHAAAGKLGSRRRAVLAAARVHAVAGVGLLLIATIPHGHLPDRPLHWLLFLPAGAVVGAACGAVIGVVCSGAAPVGLSDVWSLARTPGAALRQLLDPEDLLKLGHAVRERTTHLFEGMFEPAKRPPPEPPPTKPEPPKE